MRTSDPRSDKSRKSVIALNSLLGEISNSPSKYLDNSQLIGFLKSQGKLAKLSDDHRGILPCSLNTLKRSATSAISGGFGALDKARNEALDAIQFEANRAKRKEKFTKVGLKNRIQEQDKLITMLVDEVSLLTSLLHESHEQARDYVRLSNDELIEALFKKQHSQTLDKLSLSKPLSAFRRLDNAK